MTAHTKYWYAKSDDMWRIIGYNDVHRWVNEFLPGVVKFKYHGDIFLTDAEYMVLVLRFGSGNPDRMK